jgi:MFS family permease
MHTEHLQNVHPVRIMAGWLVAVAATSLVIFAFIVLGLMGDEAARDTAWAVAAVAVGFLFGGWFTGMRTLEAPILHGIALGLTSLVAWAVLNIVVTAAFGEAEWTALSATATLVVLLTQIVAAVAGCWVGTRLARFRAAEVSDSPSVGVRDRGAP